MTEPFEPQPRQLILTVFGLYARAEANWLSVSSVVRLMADLGVDSAAVRSSISRLKRRDILLGVRRDGVAGYTLSDGALELLLEGDRRIFDRRRGTLADGWLLLVFSVPESERDQRHLLRTELVRLGFGTTTSGVWIAPRHLEDETRHALRRLGLSGYVELFHAEHLAFGSLADKVGQWWDLPAMRARYTEFAARYRPLRRRWANRPPAGAAAFAAHVELLTAWRRLPYLDPGLPLELLPARWPGLGAAELFAELDELLRPAAAEHVRAVLDS
ncbi:MAG TPA: PaaX family transcriptional regulator C-terminal domain-containing protein [Jatrophihabitans sp.]